MVLFQCNADIGTRSLALTEALDANESLYSLKARDRCVTAPPVGAGLRRRRVARVGSLEEQYAQGER